MPGVSIVKVVHVSDDNSVTEALRVACEVDALLLDIGDPCPGTKELGGTGPANDWSLSARIVEDSAVAIYLTGGPGPANVGEAIGVVRPFGVDLCTGVRTAGALDDEKLSRFMAAVAATARYVQCSPGSRSGRVFAGPG